ncbi:HTH_Tnp_Tc3_2 domain-containing protein [Trichonephila clavipes]|nr:HTH_Tnp_Tc3_2 domain-containing protein [Trichonephila clavipes]
MDGIMPRDALERNRQQVVAWCWQQWITERIIYRRGGPWHSRNTNVWDDRAIIRAASFSPTTFLESVRHHLPPSRHPKFRRPLRRLPLTSHHRQCLWDFYRTRASWSGTSWRRVILSDESRFTHSRCIRLWRRPGYLSDLAFAVERHQAITQGVTV